MEVSGLLCGGAPVIKKYQVDATVVAGVPALIDTTTQAGLNAATTTSLADAVGITLDAATYSTTQGSGSSSAEALVSIVINPDAIVRARFSGSATSGTALTTRDVTTASSGGTAITTGDAWNSPETVDGWAVGYTGANVGQGRKITSSSATAATVLIPFDYATVVGDEFIWVPVAPHTLDTVTLTSDLTEVRQDVAVATNTGTFACIDLDLKDSSFSGTTDSFGYFVFVDHFLNKTS